MAAQHAQVPAVMPGTGCCGPWVADEDWETQAEEGTAGRVTAGVWVTRGPASLELHSPAVLWPLCAPSTLWGIISDAASSHVRPSLLCPLPPAPSGPATPAGPGQEGLGFRLSTSSPPGERAGMD